MPFGMKYITSMSDGMRPADKYKTNPPADKDKAVKAVKSYEQVRNTVMEAPGSIMQNVSQVVSNLKKKGKPREGIRKARK